MKKEKYADISIISVGSHSQIMGLETIANPRSWASIQQQAQDLWPTTIGEQWNRHYLLKGVKLIFSHQFRFDSVEIHKNI